jgi:hypothetical protein
VDVICSLDYWFLLSLPVFSFAYTCRGRIKLMASRGVVVRTLRLITQCYVWSPPIIIKWQDGKGDCNNFNEYTSYYTAALWSVLFTDALYPAENNLLGGVRTNRKLPWRLLLEVGEKYEKFEIHEATLRKRLKLNLTGGPKMEGYFTE